MDKFRGTGVALVTPFSSNGKVDHASLKRLVDHVINGGVNYLVILGTTGESATLSSKEKTAVIETIIAHNDGRVPNVLGCGGNNTSQVAETITEWTGRFNPDGFLSVSPYYNKPTQKGIEAHYEVVCAATDKPVILYNVPGRTASNVLPETTLNIAAHSSNVVAVKEASGDIEQGMNIIQGRRKGFLVLSGDDILTLPMIASGYDGVISVVANSLPEPFTQMVNKALSGDFEGARKIHYRLKSIMQLNFAEGNPAGVKAVLEHLEVCGRQVRLPLVQASDDLAGKLKEAYQSMLLQEPA